MSSTTEEKKSSSAKPKPKVALSAPARKPTFAQAGSLTLTPVSTPSGRVIQIKVPAPTEVAEIELQSTTPLEDGSANDGTGTSTQKGYVHGHVYSFKVTKYSTSTPPDASAIKWSVKYTSPTESKNKEIEKTLATSGEAVDIIFDEKDICGCNVTVTAYILNITNGANLTNFHHNRYQWFDSQKVNKQIAQRQKDPWRVNQGGTSLCGMAALYYIMLKRDPIAYEKLTKELLRVGEFSIGKYSLKPTVDSMYSVDPKGAEYRAMEIFEADWLTLATTRSCESNFGYDGIETNAFDKLKAVNWPGMLTRVVEDIAGYGTTDSNGLVLAGLLVNKSWVGQIHDRFSDSDLEDLIEIDKKFRSGKQILLMVDLDILFQQADFSSRDVVSYAPSNLFLDSHWIVYEGGLHFVDSNGAVTTNPSNAARAFFNVYTWGANPTNADTYRWSKETSSTQDVVAQILSLGITIASWKSNYYGYIEAS